MRVDVASLTHNLKYKGWGDPIKGIRYSPIDVMQSPAPHKVEHDRILNANLKYPIIIHKNNIVDGVHRLAKCVMGGRHTINVYAFDNSLMKKFLVNSKRDAFL